ncbi:MAG: 16S rRNA (adenine(1518)-N(6)/adenine(1519)-N(6))-dimethyltransferase RsmA [Chloroflexota bacterium]|nr:16S rRNA (adenine(1518)-N(6)/adenine(1519)-N(6))-dimethyltransferase RsmA [Chloroflexota bacterium]
MHSAKIISLLRRHDIRPSKGLGQNFLVDTAVYDDILEASAVGASDVVLEVGPGLGLLTLRLAERAKCVVAVELDRKMISVLEDVLEDRDTVHIVQGDILEVDPVTEIARALNEPNTTAMQYKVVANPPYYITSALIRHLLTARVRPTQLTLMLQEEVAERIVAEPGDLSLLAVSVQYFGEPELVRRVPAGAFYPRPEVNSAILNIHVYGDGKRGEKQREAFFRTVRAGFAHRRKQIHNSLTHNLHISHEYVLEALKEAGIDPKRRPQTLTIEEWEALAASLPL